MIAVLVVDDHPVVRSGIVQMLDSDPDLEVVGEAANGNEALTVLNARAVDVMLTDLRMPGMDGVELAYSAAELADPPKIVVLTTYDSDSDILRAVEAGAVGYLLKDARKSEIIQAVKAASAGQSSLSPRVVQTLVAHTQKAAVARLSPRETEVLAEVSNGFTNSQIASHLGVSLGTVKTHLERIYEKLGASDRASAVATAHKLGYL
jgi:Response regulator containing a CheY-like receiver domain and an HTH DNA-binding domain